MGMTLHPKYCSYIPLLFRAMTHISGDVLELGGGLHSTFILHWLCWDQGRQLYTYDNDPQYYEVVKQCEATDFHSIHLVDDWDAVEIEREWGIVLVDHGPPERRKIEAMRLADCAQCILLHDSQWQAEKHYGYKSIFGAFRYLYHYPAKPQTTAVSNFVDVSAWT